MSALLLDTHVWAWSLNGDKRLSATAAEAMSEASAILLSPVSFYEIAQKVRLGKWPQMAPLVHQLPALFEKQGGLPADFTLEISRDAGLLDWAHRDPFDRIILATALALNVPLISADAVFNGQVQTIW